MFERFVTYAMSADTHPALLHLATAYSEMHWTSQNASCIKENLLFSNMIDLILGLMSLLHVERFVSFENKEYSHQGAPYEAH